MRASFPRFALWRSPATAPAERRHQLRGQRLRRSESGSLQGPADDGSRRSQPHGGSAALDSSRSTWAGDWWCAAILSVGRHPAKPRGRARSASAPTANAAGHGSGSLAIDRPRAAFDCRCKAPLGLIAWSRSTSSRCRWGDRSASLAAGEPADRGVSGISTFDAAGLTAKADPRAQGPARYGTVTNTARVEAQARHGRARDARGTLNRAARGVRG